MAVKLLKKWTLRGAPQTKHRILFPHLRFNQCGEDTTVVIRIITLVIPIPLALFPLSSSLIPALLTLLNLTGSDLVELRQAIQLSIDEMCVY